jgi:hypothetical protein
VERKDIPRYPGNTTALGVGARPYKKFSAIMTGINPVPGPRMGKVNKLYLRYRLSGSTDATFQHFSLSSNDNIDLTDMDNRHIRLSGLKEGVWRTCYLDFTKNARRNDGTSTPFAAGHRVDDIFFFVKADGGTQPELLIDEVVLYDAGKQGATK